MHVCVFVHLCTAGRVFVCICGEMKSMDVLICRGNRNIVLIPVTVEPLASICFLVISHLIVYFGGIRVQPALCACEFVGAGLCFLYCGGVKV